MAANHYFWPNLDQKSTWERASGLITSCSSLVLLLTDFKWRLEPKTSPAPPKIIKNTVFSLIFGPIMVANHYFWPNLDQLSTWECAGGLITSCSILVSLLTDFKWRLELKIYRKPPQKGHYSKKTCLPTSQKSPVLAYKSWLGFLTRFSGLGGFSGKLKNWTFKSVTEDRPLTLHDQE